MSVSRSGSTTRARRQVTRPTELEGRLGSPTVRARIVTALVGVQAVLVVLVLVPLGPVLWSGPTWLGWLLVGLGLLVGGLGVLGLGRDTRISPIPPSGGRLHREGIYAFIRHPMYLGLILATAGVTVASGRLLALLATLGLGVVLVTKARVESEILQRKFGWEFTLYSMRVPAFVPQPWRSHRR